MTFVPAVPPDSTETSVPSGERTLDYLRPPHVIEAGRDRAAGVMDRVLQVG
jgi:hypothetical protein